MLASILRLCFRNIKRHKGFSVINIAGITFGLTACILIGFFVWDEYQYDKFIPGGESVYRIYDERTGEQGMEKLSVTPPMFAEVLQQQFPEVEKAVRVLMQPEYKALFEEGRKEIYEQNGYYADSTFFYIFPLSFKYGTSLHVLDDPAAIVISDEMAERFFGDENPVGKQILMDKEPLQVKGVFEKNPKFHLQFNFLRPLSAAQIPADRMQSWTWQQFYTYVKIKGGADIPSLETRFQKKVTEEAGPHLKDADFKYVPFFQQLSKIHLYSSDFKFDMVQRGNITYVNAFSIIAGFILLMACFNFINLATARSIQRAKEVGVRKAIGAKKSELVIQFIGETITLALVSTVLSVILAIILLPWLNQFSGKNIPMSLFAQPSVILLFIILAVSIGVLAGFYPSLVLSKFEAAKVLKGSLSVESTPGRIPWLRHSLVLLQFALSVLLIISVLVVYNQVRYLHNKDLGFDKNQIMFFPMRGDEMFKNNDAFKNDLTQIPGVSSVSIGYGFPGDAVAGDEIIVPRNGQRVTESVTQLMVDFDYIRTLGLQIVAGRDFSKDMGSDKDHAWIINETAVKQFGFGTPEKALGATLFWHPWGASDQDSLKIGQIIGVVRDFNYKSLYDKVAPTVLQVFPDAAWKVAVKLQSQNLGKTVNRIQQVWNKFCPGYPMEYKFLDENFEEMYKGEDKLRSLLFIFTSIAIFIGCLGLFGLAAYSAERRKKEVGIRKILGATTSAVALTLSRNFIQPVIVSLLIASPVAWYFSNKWLENFAYRITVSWWMFAIAGVLTISIAFLTISFQVVKAALANPVKSLRAE